MKCKKIGILLSAIIGLTPTTCFAEGLGISTHVNKGYNYYANLEVIENTGIKWLRDECVWDSVERERGVFSVPKRMKKYYRTAKENGVKTLLILNYGNDAYTLSDGTQATTKTMPSVDEPEYMEGWKQYVRTIVEEMGDYIDVYEVWNEPNLSSCNLNITDNYVSTYNKAARIYAELYLETKAILDELQPGKPVLFGSISGYAGKVASIFISQMEAVAAEWGMTLDEAVDDVSYHYYVNQRAQIYDGSESWEKAFDTYGIDARLWYTETGLSNTVDSTATDSDAPYTQAEYLPMAALEWDRFVFANNREGVAFWYDLRNDGTDSTAKESNFGLVDYYYEPKEAFYAMQARNKAVKYMPMTNYETPVIYSGLLGLTKAYGILGTYSDGIDTTYVGYHEDEKDGSVNVQLSGQKAYVYDYLGNVIDEVTVTDDNTTYDMPINETITYVSCVNTRTDFSYVNYDNWKCVLTLKGVVSESEADETEITITDTDGKEVYAETVKLADNKFVTEISISESGTYTITAGADISEYYATCEVTVGKQTERSVLGDSVISINDDTVTIAGIVNNAADGETVSVLVVPCEADLENLKPENIAYIDDAEITDDAYSVTFNMPEKSDGAYKVLLSGADLENSDEKNLTYGTASEYVNVCEFDYTYGNNVITITAGVNNPLPTSESCTVIVAQYNSDGKLVDVLTTPIAVDENVAQIIEKTVSVSKSNEATTAKAMIWDSMNGLYPLINGLLIPLN